ncbi:ABC transporter ATP-binding protein [Rhizobium leguminosarum]|uniref:ABC transporter ATP-binding protein n=1 Tax=Rhizobium leguminosarum TaxID=384 RepID=UPI0021BC1308|nr:ATP-binding cassette domain-containing protein [Rhizobium leguminosarum]
MQVPVLSASSIAKVFRVSGKPVIALRGVSIAPLAGETFGIVGESGSGKSTLGRIAVGLETPSGGALYIEGERVDALPASLRREKFRRCQMIFQDPYSSLNPRLSIGKQIGEAIYARGVSDWREIRSDVGELLEKVGLRRELADRYPHEFSGGERQRIAIARALAPSPGVVVADEPVSALDVSIQAQILDLMEAVRRENSLCYILISHDMSVIARLCDRVAVMHQGRIVELGPTPSVIEKPQHPYTRNLLDAVPRFGRRRSDQKSIPEVLPLHDDHDNMVEISNGHFVLESLAKLTKPAVVLGGARTQRACPGRKLVKDGG